MKYLKSPEYILTMVLTGIIAYFRPVSFGTTTLFIAGLCASYIVGRGLIHTNTGSMLPDWKCPELHFLMAVWGHGVYAFYKGETTDAIVAVFIAQATYNIFRQLGKRYRADNPVMLR